MQFQYAVIDWQLDDLKAKSPTGPEKIYATCRDVMFLQDVDGPVQNGLCLHSRY